MLNGDALLDLYQRGAGSHALNRAILLGHALLGADVQDMALGELDRQVWQGRREFLAQSGLPGTAPAVVSCPDCQSRLEFALPANFMIPNGFPDIVDLEWAGENHQLRMPTLSDFDHGGLKIERLGAGPWGDTAFRHKAESALQQQDPALDIRLAMTCPDCGAAFSSRFDPIAFFWAELEEMASQLVDDVTCLASAFGWAEQDILAMSPGRRALYLARVAS